MNGNLHFQNSEFSVRKFSQYNFIKFVIHFSKFSALWKKIVIHFSEFSALGNKIGYHLSKFSALWNKFVIHFSQFSALWNKIVIHLSKFSTLRRNCDPPPPVPTKFSVLYKTLDFKRVSFCKVDFRYGNNFVQCIHDGA